MAKIFKSNIFILLLIALIIWLLFTMYNLCGEKKSLYNDINSMKMEIITKDSLVKIKDGEYTKLVNYYNTESDLTKKLKDSNKELVSEIKDKKEKVLQLTGLVASLRGQLSSGSVDSIGKDSLSISIFYPQEEDWFINWKGLINTNELTYDGSWNFSRLKLNIVLTEEVSGIWRTRINGPDYFVIDSLKIESLPPQEYIPNKSKKLSLLVGAGVRRYYGDNPHNKLVIGAGLKYKDVYLIMDAATDNSVTGKLIFKIR